jgi:hypothetical protein
MGTAHAITAAIVPAHTPIFFLYPVMARGNIQLEDARAFITQAPAQPKWLDRTMSHKAAPTTRRRRSEK